MPDLSFAPDSSHIKLVTYNPSTKQMAVTFSTNGKTYTHTDVPHEIYESARQRRSFGQYYHGTIKHRYKLLATGQK